MEELENMKELVDKFIKDAEEFIKEYKEKYGENKNE